MRLLEHLGLSGSNIARLHREFPLVIERRTPLSRMRLDLKVSGYFVGKRGRTDFVTEKVVVRGLPDMNLKSFLPDELQQVRRYALSIEFPRMLELKGR